eukprot:scpid94692/ scgid32047/ 
MSVEGLRSQRLLAVLKGIERTQFDTRRSEAGNHAGRQRLPVAPSDLLTIKAQVGTSAHSASDKAMMWAALLTAFYGLLRVGEYASTSTGEARNLHTLTVAQVQIAETEVVINLGPTKTSQFGGGGTVLLHASANKELCPVEAVKVYRSRRRWSNAEVPFFVHDNGKQLTQKDINLLLKRALGPEVSSHSLRKGG